MHAFSKTIVDHLCFVTFRGPSNPPRAGYCSTSVVGCWRLGLLTAEGPHNSFKRPQLPFAFGPYQAKIVGKGAFITTFSSDSVEAASKENPDQFHVAEEEGVKSSEEMLRLILKRI